MALWLQIDPRAAMPIYRQIVEQVEHALAVGTVRPGERLPTVRQLSAELGIAQNTIIKAYNELQRMGMVETRVGFGTVAAPEAEGVVRERQIDALFDRLRQIALDGAGLGVPPEELVSRFRDAVFGPQDRGRNEHVS